jgi:hypothetical protein
MIRKKYKKEKNDLIKELKSKDSKVTKVISVELLDKSKVKDNYIYECAYLDCGELKVVSIIAIDVTQALAKLEPYVNLGIPPQTLKYMIGNERFTEE